MSKESINQAIELFHRRWVLRVIWELRSSALTFRELRAACGDISPTVLNQRLRDLRAARIVVHTRGRGYHLTSHGMALVVAMQPMLRWARDWHRAVYGD